MNNYSFGSSFNALEEILRANIVSGNTNTSVPPPITQDLNTW